MPYEIQSRCHACGQGDTFLIGNWPEHLGVHVCAECHALVNIPVETGQCPGCGQQPSLQDFYDYSFAVPYLGGQMPRQPEPGPACPKCQRAPLTFENNVHLNMGMIVSNAEKARATWGREYMEKAIFMNSALPIIEEFELSPAKIFEYFNLDTPTAPLITERISFPILLDIPTHLGTAMLVDPEMFGGNLTQDEVQTRLWGGGRGPQVPSRKRWWPFWK